MQSECNNVDTFVVALAHEQARDRRGELIDSCIIQMKSKGVYIPNLLEWCEIVPSFLRDTISLTFNLPSQVQILQSHCKTRGIECSDEKAFNIIHAYLILEAVKTRNSVALEALIKQKKNFDINACVHPITCDTLLHIAIGQAVADIKAGIHRNVAIACMKTFMAMNPDMNQPNAIGETPKSLLELAVKM